MTALPVPRWAVSFADLILLLLGCFVMLHAMEAARPKAAPSPAAPVSELGARYRTADLFEPGEARLNAGAQERLRAAADGLERIRIVSRGTGEGSDRLDRFELGAARAAAVARVLRAAGAAEVAIEMNDAAAAGGGQTIALTEG
jgi:flagellar motor protein MotB